MLAEAKRALRVTVSDFDGEIMRLLKAGAMDLMISGVEIPGLVSWTEGQSGVTDTSTVTDDLVLQALITYARMSFGSPPDYDRLRAAYEIQKVQLMHATGYTDYGEDSTEEAETGTGEEAGSGEGGEGA